MSEIWQIAAEQEQAQQQVPGKCLCRATSSDAREPVGSLSGRFLVFSFISKNAIALCMLDSEALHLVRMCKVIVKSPYPFLEHSQLYACF